MSIFSNVSLNSPLTAFGELVVSEKSPIVQGTFEYTVSNTDLNSITVSGSGAVANTNAMAVLSTGTTTSSTAVLQSKHSLKYNGGIGGVGRFTAMYTTPVANTEQYEGIADEVGSSATLKNGFTIGYTGTTLGIQRWSGDTLTEIARTSWDDKLDGTGPSGITIDFTKINIFQIQYQYLGAGNIYFFVENPNSGRLIVFHTLKYANLNTTPSVRMPSFKFTAIVKNKTTTSNITLSTASYGLFAEGKARDIMIHQPQFATGMQTASTVTTEKALMTIKNKLTYPTASPKTNFIKVSLERIACNIDNNGTTNIGTIRLVKNATLGGTPSYTDISATNSLVSLDTAGTTVTGGITMMTVSLSGKNDGKEENLVPFDFFIEPGDTVTVAVSSTNTATIKAELLWKELF